MKKPALFLITLVVSTCSIQAKAECLKLLTDDFSRSSSAIVTNNLDTIVDSGSDDFSHKRTEYVYHRLVSAMRDVGCGIEELGINYKDSSSNGCRRLRKNDANSEVCYFTGTVGLFIAREDFLGNLGIIFNRWD